MSVFNAYIALSGKIHAEVKRDVALSRLTSVRIGGAAALYVAPHDYAALSRTIEVLSTQKLPWIILGRGSSILASDEGYRGCVIVLTGEFEKLSVDGPTGMVTAGAATRLAKACSTALTAGLSGMEFLAGIPGSVGGALFMNAGTERRWLSSIVHDVVSLKPGVGLVRRPAAEIDWGRRWCSLPTDEIILEVTFSLQPAQAETIAQKMETHLGERSILPLGAQSCGALFVEPRAASVNELVRRCGLRGAREGGAQLHPSQANYVVNRGGACAADVLALMNRVHSEVLAYSSVDLHSELKLLGFEI
ncbi:MAG: UDP-N-acetylmuramate dehydrogenase [Coriobacteriaceae bacterium]|nr:UDP-N-acetylmuramate dehydrogenase [Coriobacteriaceae bacterium]